MIEVKNLSKSFDGFAALSELSLTVPDGAVYGLVGPNGAGKSTVIRHITGIYRPDCGEVRIDGQPVYENQEIKSRLAYIPDDLSHHAGESIREISEFYRHIYPRFNQARFAQLSEVFPLNQKQPLRRFSKGMQKQAAFWLAISCMPDYLILDEPVDGLDPVMRRQIWSLLLEDVASRGMSVLVSSHNLRELEDVCDHVGVMHRGRLLLERSLEELQGNVVKVQLVTDAEIPDGLEILHASSVGRIQTLIVRGNAGQIEDRLSACSPLLCDLLPLSLEEIFIYELGGMDYDVKNILL